jgi:hypothetical protein
MAAARPRQKRRTDDQPSKLFDTLATLACKKCIASYIRDEHGDVFMILMADNCPACVEAKRQLQARRQQTEARPVPSPPLTAADESLPETSREELMDPECIRLVNMGVEREIEEIAQRKQSTPAF